MMYDVLAAFDGIASFDFRFHLQQIRLQTYVSNTYFTLLENNMAY